MIKISTVLFCFLITVYCSGEFTILRAPNSIKFKGQEALDKSLLKEVYSAALGQPIAQSSKWSGMYFSDPFNLAEAIITVEVDGLVDLDNSKGHTFPLKTDESGREVFEALETRIYEQNPSAENNIIYVDLSQGLDAVQSYNFLTGIKDIKPEKNSYNYLKFGFLEDREFIGQLQLFNAIAEKIENGAYQRSSAPMVFWFRFSGYQNVINLHGENSTAAKEAKTLLSETIVRVQRAFEKLYEGDVLINILTNEITHARYARAVSIDGRVDINFDTLNLASTYSENFPVMFNIILWFSIIMGFSLLAICIIIGDMDPGRDSIIYRMTSTRMKKDN